MQSGLLAARGFGLRIGVWKLAVLSVGVDPYRNK